MYGGKLYFRGIIDEINYDPRTNQLEVVEFKTRASKSAPKPQQTYTHEVQVNIYRTLLDELIQGQVDKSLYFERYNLQASMALCDAVRQGYKDQGFAAIETLEHAFDLLVKLAFQLPTITTRENRSVSTNFSLIVRLQTVQLNIFFSQIRAGSIAKSSPAMNSSCNSYFSIPNRSGSAHAKLRV